MCRHRFGMRDFPLSWLWTRVPRWMWLLANLWDMNMTAPFCFKKLLKGFNLFTGHARSLYSPESGQKHKQGTEGRRVADSYNESVQGTDHIYRRLNLVVNLGNEVALFPNFLFNQNHRSYGRNWSKIKGNSQLDAVVHFMCNISLRSLRNVPEETRRWHVQVQILSVALNTLAVHFSPFKVHTYVCSSDVHLIMFYKTI